MLTRLFIVLSRLSPAAKRGLWRQWYQFLAGRYPIHDWTFMNYGYASLDADADRLELAVEDEQNRYCIQLYHHVASRVDIENLDVLEVGSGRGGGAAYVARYLKPKTMAGVDFSEQAIAFSRRHHKHPGLSFINGDAENLPFGENYVDVVINVESSHCYGSMPTFLAQVRRVLRPGGHFLFADFRSHEDIRTLHHQLHNSGMTVRQEVDVTANVVRSLELDNERKLALMKRLIGRRLLGTFQEFAGVQGSKMYKGFLSKRMLYKHYILQK